MSRLISIVPGLIVYSEVPIAYLSLVTLVPGFIASGLAMMVIPGALALWIVHLALFVPACVCLGLHLFRTLLYRKSRSVQITAVVALCMITACAVWIYGPRQLKDRVIELRVRRGADIIAPGHLTASHSNDPKLDRCNACHELFSLSPSEKCLSCHQMIGQRTASQSGFHGKLAGPCRTCHPDHAGVDADIRNFDTSKFDHNLANYKLQGRHSGLPCRECHLVKVDENIKTQTKYIGLNFEKCDDCHDDPHGGQFRKSCDKCHDEHDWKTQPQAKYHGMDSSYPLVGKHSKVECAQCHLITASKTKLAEADFVSLTKTCKQCHKDPHAGQISAACDTCHTDDGWTGRALLFSHDKQSDFALDAVHVNVECAHCHQDSGKTVYRPLPKTCDTCHKNIEELGYGNARLVTVKPDPHAGRVSCVQCHQTDKQKQKPSEYADKCKSCHNDDYGRLYQNWSTAFDVRKSQADKLLSQLRKTDPVKADQMAEQITKAEHAGFHNIQLARQLWHNILSQER